MRETVWDRLFPGQIPEIKVIATPREGNRIVLEGHSLRVAEVGHSDTDDTTVQPPAPRLRSCAQAGPQAVRHFGAPHPEPPGEVAG